MQQIGRFEILKELGKGGQGAVYLARDSQLDRQVAIKTLLNVNKGSDELINEARLASKLQHPNIITLFDFGSQQGMPYLVYAYVKGQTLAQTLQKNIPMPLVQAAEIAIGILSGLASAHEQKIVHLDIKPANIMISDSGTPMVMDFGLARLSNDAVQAKDPSLNGTPRYVSPEQVAGQIGTVLSDIYAVGALLYEMVSGHHAVPGEDLFEILNRVANATIRPPSEWNNRVDEALEGIILKSLSKDPQARYGNAQLMRQALQDYLGSHQLTEPSGEAGDNSTLEFLLRRMRTKKDFPAISGSIAEINRIIASESTSGARLASAILQDFSLTSKLLKLVNAATYGQFGGRINTVSKAVVVLGFETVRSIASSLMLLEFLQNKPQAAHLKEEISHAVLSSVVAVQLAVGQNVRDAEEVMVCAMFHNLGRLLTIYYFFDESQEIARLVEQGEDENKAALKVLGISYSDLGQGVARSWNFSERMVTAMAPITEIKTPKNDQENLALVVNLASELCDVANGTSSQDKSAHVDRLIKRYSSAIKLDEKKLTGALDRGLGDFTRRSTLLGLKLGKPRILDKVRAWNGATTSEQPTTSDTQTQNAFTLPDDVEETRSNQIKPEVVLGAGIQDVTNSLVNEFKLNDVLQMILETIYRGMGFNRAVLLIRDNKRREMVARYGLGHGVEEIMPDLHFSLDYTPDVFHLSISKGLDIAIENTQAPNIADKIPAWYWHKLNAPCFLLLPAMVKDKTICMFYADMQKVNGLNASKQELSLLRTLRNQAVLAIKQKI